MLGVAIAIRQVDCNAAFTFLHLNNTERSRTPVASNTASETAHNVNPGESNGGVVSGFRTEPNSGQTHNVTATAPGDPGYSPLWLRVVYDSADWLSVHNLDTALKARKVPAEVLTINCPVVLIEH